MRNKTLLKLKEQAAKASPGGRVFGRVESLEFIMTQLLPQNEGGGILNKDFKNPNGPEKKRLSTAQCRHKVVKSSASKLIISGDKI